MEVPGLCSVCHRPGILETCALCGALLHAHCRDLPAHQHGGPGSPGGRRKHDWGEPRV